MPVDSVVNQECRRTPRSWVTTITGFAILVTVAGGLALDRGQKARTGQLPLVAQSTAPSAPPASVCDQAAVLSGPAAQPIGSVRVAPGDGLAALTGANPPGTTFWLAPGVHTLGTGRFDQIIPADNMTFLGAPGAILDGQGVNAYAFTQKASNVRIAYLTIQNFVAPRDEGVVNHDQAPGWIIEHNTIQHNRGAGVFVGDNNHLRYNCLRSNGQYGLQGWGNTFVVDHNEVTGNNVDDLETVYPGCGCTGGAKFWGARHARVTNNWVHDNRGVGLWADTNNVDFLFEGNYIENNDSMGLMYETSYNAVIRDNTFKRNAIKSGKSNPFPNGAIYLSEAGGDSRLSSAVTGSPDLSVSGNNFVDNWDGVVLWENADRFCGSPANTSSGHCTVVNPQANLTTCNDPAVGGSINVEPYYSDCRWKTQNVKVSGNTFSFDPVAVGCTTGACGRNGVFANYGTYPSWSPYKGHVVQDAITFRQGNVWGSNSYTGPWTFTPRDQSASVSFAVWQAAPYNQDAGSTFANGSAAPSTAPSTSSTAPSTVPSTSSTAVTTVPSTSTPTTSRSGFPSLLGLQDWYQTRDSVLSPSTSTTTATTTTGSPASRNSLDADTAGLEGSIGAWAPWYSAAISRSPLSAHTGRHSLRVDVTASHGWGVQLSNYPGVATTAGNKTIRLWGLLGSGPSTGVTMRVKWLDTSGAVLHIDAVSLRPLNAGWQSASAAAVAPPGTARMWVELVGDAVAGTTIFLDDIEVSQ